jgi:hypothetical protein
MITDTNTYAGQQWWYKFRAIPRFIKEDRIESYSRGLAQKYSFITTGWDADRNSEWIVRIYLSAKMILSASVMLESLEYAERKNLRTVIPNLEYYSILSCLRSVIFVSPLLKWQNGMLITQTHKKTINAVSDWLSILDRELSNKFKKFILHLKAYRELISYRAPSSGDSFKKSTEFDVIELCQLLVELAQLQSEVLERSIHKNVKGKFNFKKDYIAQVCHSEIDGNSFWDKEDAYRLDYLRRKYPLPTNIQHIMSEGHVEDFFGSWCAEEDTDADIFDPDDNWYIIFDVTL